MCKIIQTKDIYGFERILTVALYIACLKFVKAKATWSFNFLFLCYDLQGISSVGGLREGGGVEGG